MRWDYSFPVLANFFPVLARQFQFLSVTLQKKSCISAKQSSKLVAFALDLHFLCTRNFKRIKTFIIMEEKKEKKQQLDEQQVEEVNGGRVKLRGVFVEGPDVETYA